MTHDPDAPGKGAPSAAASASGPGESFFFASRPPA
jgi:hypothetical protein